MAGGGLQRMAGPYHIDSHYEAKEHKLSTDSFEERIYWHLHVKGNFDGIGPPKF